MSPTRYALITLRAFLICMWSVTAAATVAVAAAPPERLDPWLLLWSVVVSVLAGGTALAIRINNFLLEQDQRAADGKATVPLTRPWLFAGSHMGGSLLAGMTSFFYWQPRADLHWLLLCVLAASFVGAKFVEMAAEKLLPVTPLGPVSRSP